MNNNMKKFLLIFFAGLLYSCEPATNDISSNIRKIDDIIINATSSKTDNNDWYGEFPVKEWQRSYRLNGSREESDYIYNFIEQNSIKISKYNADSAVLEYAGYELLIPIPDSSVINIPQQSIKNIYDDYDVVEGRLVMKKKNVYSKIIILQSCQDWGYENFGIEIKK